MASTSNNTEMTPQQLYEYYKRMYLNQQTAAINPYNPRYPSTVSATSTYPTTVAKREESYWEQMAQDLSVALKLANEELARANTRAENSRADADKYAKLLAFLLINHKDVVDEFILVEKTKKRLEVEE